MNTSISITPDTSNEIFQLAADLVNQTGRNLFLTGKAGTGKTTFLKFIRENCPKQMAIVAPTGVAAINAGGVTIHSFFQIPPGIFLPTRKRSGFGDMNTEVHDQHSLTARLRFNNDKRKVFRQLELLVIDEVSMVRSDLLDAIDTVLRFVRKRPNEAFGGVQVLFIGDLYQLPPVTRDTDWQKLGEFYNSPFFFDSQVLKEQLPLYIEFQKIYRQTDQSFINLLNQVRNNQLNEDGMNLLESRYNPGFRRKKDDGYIILTTHNEQARNTNSNQLQQLPGMAVQYDALTTGDFPENASPADPVLYLKTGAQVMFIKNDSAERGKRYYNGKIGFVTRMEDERVFVKCEGEAEIGVDREKWKNIRYNLNSNTQKLEEDELGSFSQFPIRLAWAITIHKSQGLTFEKAIIDAGEAFAPGQVYVALSRCTSLEGMVLKSRLRNNSLLSDPRVTAFSANIASSDWLKTELEKAKKEYQEKILLSCFDFSIVQHPCLALKQYLQENDSSFSQEALAWAVNFYAAIGDLQATAHKFQVWLMDQFNDTELPAAIPAIQERSAKAAAHFLPAIEKMIQEILQCPVITDSRQHAKECNDLLKEVYTLFSTMVHQLKSFNGHWDTAIWQKNRQNFTLPSYSINTYAGAGQKQTLGPHPALFMRLKELRDTICSRKDLPIFKVAASNTLQEICRFLPQSIIELRQINGFGEHKLKLYGQQFLEIIQDYCEENNLESRIAEKALVKEVQPGIRSGKKKADTYAASFLLYKEGKSIDEIAAARSLSRSTIEGHLCRYISQGEIDINTLIKPEKLAMIEEALLQYDGKSITPIKQKLPPDISFGEIRIAMAAQGISQAPSSD